MEAAQVILPNQFNDLLKIGFRFRCQLAQVRLPVRRQVPPTIARPKVVPPTSADVVFVSEINPALGQVERRQEFDVRRGITVHILDSQLVRRGKESLSPLGVLLKLLRADLGVPAFQIDIRKLLLHRGHLRMILDHPVTNAAIEPVHLFAGEAIDPHHGLFALERPTRSDCGAGVVRHRISVVVPIDSFEALKKAAFFHACHGISELGSREKVEQPLES